MYARLSCRSRRPMRRRSVSVWQQQVMDRYVRSRCWSYLVFPTKARRSAVRRLSSGSPLMAAAAGAATAATPTAHLEIARRHLIVKSAHRGEARHQPADVLSGTRIALHTACVRASHQCVETGVAVLTHVLIERHALSFCMSRCL